MGRTQPECIEEAKFSLVLSTRWLKIALSPKYSANPHFDLIFEQRREAPSMITQPKTFDKSITP